MPIVQGRLIVESRFPLANDIVDVSLGDFDAVEGCYTGETEIGNIVIAVRSDNGLDWQIRESDLQELVLPKVAPSLVKSKVNDQAILVEDPQVDRLHALLKNIAPDDAIVGGVNLNDAAFEKIAEKFAITADEARLLFAKLKMKLRKSLSEANEGRFSYEKDFLGNVTVYDGETSKSRFLSGEDAAKLLNDLDTGDAQAVIASHNLFENDVEHQAALNATGFWGKRGAGSIIMAKRTGRILLAHRSSMVEEPGTWGNWGGAIDGDEEPIAAVAREFREETGGDAKILDIVPLYVFRAKGNTFTYYNFLLVVEDEFEPRLNWEAQNSTWCTLKSLPSPLHFGLKALFSDAESVAKIEEYIAKAGAEPVTEETEEDEVEQRGGSYNFPWKDGKRHGFATARFGGSHKAMKVEVIDCRDNEGDQIDAADYPEDIQSQAVAFIGKE